MTTAEWNEMENFNFLPKKIVLLLHAFNNENIHYLFSILHRRYRSSIQGRF